MLCRRNKFFSSVLLLALAATFVLPFIATFVAIKPIPVDMVVSVFVVAYRTNRVWKVARQP